MPRFLLDRSGRERWAGVILALTLSSFAAPLRAKAPTASADVPLKTNRHNPDAVAAVIAITHYQSPDLPDVDYATNDAQAVKNLLVQTLGYSASRVLVATNDRASLAQLKPLIKQELRAKVVPGKSDVFLYYSGHGVPNPNTQQAYLIPYDYNPSYEPTEDTAYPLKQLYADLGRLGARSVTVVLDACFSGVSDSAQAGRGRAVLKAAIPAFVAVENPAMQLPAGLVVTATGPEEIATWDTAHQHGLLTFYLLQAFRGEAADEQGRVTVAKLTQYLKEKVPQAAEELKHRKQTPQVITAANQEEVLVQLPMSALKTGQAVVEQAYGSLKITLIVGGDLYVDGLREKTLQAGEFFFRQRIAAGPHQIEVRKEGQPPIRDQVVVMPNQVFDKTYNFLPETPEVQKAYGLIEVSSDAGGTLYIDERKLAELSPFAKYRTGRIEAGPHQVRIEKAGYETAAREVLVRPNQTVNDEYTMQRSHAGTSTPTSTSSAGAANPPDRASVAPKQTDEKAATSQEPKEGGVGTSTPELPGSPLSNLLLGEWEAQIPGNNFRMRVEWDNRERLFKGFLSKQGDGSARAGFTLGEHCWSAQPNQWGVWVVQQKYHLSPTQFGWQVGTIGRITPQDLVTSAVRFVRVGAASPGR